MNRRTTLALALLAVVLVPAPAHPDEKAALGTWDVVAATPDGPMPFVLTLSKPEGKLKAEVELGGFKLPVSGESLEGDLLKLNAEYEGELRSIQGKIKDGAIEGTWEGGGYSGTFTGKKRP